MTDPSRLGGVFFLHGDDEFRKARAVSELVDAHLDPGTRDFNLDILRGPELEVETLASILATPPMMAEWRVVLVKETEALASSSRARELILATVDDPPRDLALILQTTIPERSKAKFYKELAKKARATSFEAVPPNDVPGWLMEWTREQHGVEMTEAAARALGSAVGADLGVLSQEVEKLVSSVGEGEAITPEVVARSGTRLPKQDRWEWFDLVGSRRFGEALPGLEVLLDQGESGVGLTIGLATHLLRLGVLAGGGSGALEEVLPPHQRWLANRLGGQARKWTTEELEHAVLGLLRVDRLLKSSSFGDRHLLEEWLLKERLRAGAAA